jgi:hypothetical protein
MISRDELARLFKEDDEFTAQHRAWMDRCRPAGGPLALQRRAAGGGLLHRVTDNALQRAPEAHADNNQDDAGWVFSEAQFESIALALHLVAKELTQERDEALAKRDQKIAELRETVVDLRGRIETLTQMFAKSGGEVIALPNWRKHGT